MKIPYKVQLRLSDFWNILEEETDEHGQLVITGTLAGKPELVVAIFPQQHGPKGYWKSSEQWELQEACSPNCTGGDTRSSSSPASHGDTSKKASSNF